MKSKTTPLNLVVTNDGNYCRLTIATRGLKDSFILYHLNVENPVYFKQQLSLVTEVVNLPLVSIHWYKFTPAVVEFIETSLKKKPLPPEPYFPLYSFPYSVIEVNRHCYNGFGHPSYFVEKISYSQCVNNLLRDKPEPGNLDKTNLNPEYILPFGKFIGCPLKEVPKSYIQWMLKELPNSRLQLMLV